MPTVAAPLDPYAVLSISADADAAVIRAAYRALAWINHPDRNPSPEAASRMRAVNAAYELVRTEERRRALRATAATERPRPARPEPGTVTFGRYAGWTIAQLARHDPDYLRWLRRHSAGQPYRREIAERLEALEKPRPHVQPTQPRRWAFFGG